MEPNVKCTKPHCNCVEIEERRTGGPVKMYPCLANAGQKNSLGDLKSMEERVKAFCQPDVMRGHRPDPLALFEQELNRLHAAKAATKDYDEKMLINCKIVDCQDALQLINELSARANGA